MHPFVSPSADSRRTGNCQLLAKYVHLVPVNRLGGLSLPRNSAVTLTDRPGMTIA